MPAYEKEVIGSLLKSRFAIPTCDDPFAELLQKLDKIPAPNERKSK